MWSRLLSSVKGKKRIISNEIGYSNSRIIILAFATVIIVGTWLLSMPFATNTNDITFIDALFTATSAVCVTGLTVQDTSKYFTFWGQLIIIILIQIGGLGVMTLSTILILFFGKKVTFTEKIIVKDALGVTGIGNIMNIVKNITVLTLLFEATGTVILLNNFIIKYHYDFKTALWFSIFHSISAFCNAGFSLFSNNLESFYNDYVLNIVIMLLIIFGGLGFIVIMNINDWFKAKYYYKKKSAVPILKLQSKVVIVSTFLLIVIPAIIILLLEWANTLSGFTFSEKLLASFFQSVTPRTAGFNTVPISKMHSATLFLIIFLMFVGASPGGTGGGVKTTTFAVLIGVFFSNIKDKDKIHLFKRTLPLQLIHRSTSIILIYLLFAFSLVFILLISENIICYKKFTFEQILFEVFSAQGTVGLSTGITMYFSDFGKLILSLGMFIGRVGALTLFVGMYVKRKAISVFNYAEESMMVG